MRRAGLTAFRPRAVSAAPLVADYFDFGSVLLGHHDGTAAGMRQHMEMALSRIARIERPARPVGGGDHHKKVGELERFVLQHADPVLRTEAQCKKSVGEPHAALRIWVRTSIVSSRVLRRSARAGDATSRQWQSR